MILLCFVKRFSHDQESIQDCRTIVTTIIKYPNYQHYKQPVDCEVHLAANTMTYKA